MIAAQVSSVPDYPLVFLSLDLALLSSVVVGQRVIVATMTNQQAHELFWALEATLGGDSQGTDDDNSCGDPDCPGPHICALP